CHFAGSRAKGLVFFRCHSRNGWRKSPAPWFPIGLLTELQTDSVPLSKTNPGVCWSLLCARVLQTRKRSYPSHGDQSGLDGDSDLVVSLVETRGIRRNRSPSERMEREPLATTNRNGND
uniref:Uncharacterized protein n=1 Tax=Pristionchus pacificus TaxID=54126 RepID=A0A8R1YVK9_PRIPA